MAVKKLSKQMEMFDDGGLKDEGGTIDPISGNDVPPGSTQEEVRDDIPAQLSEGEFVFPADVVRFIGLEKLMMMRQEAKMGLKKMEDMGQMGNSEEATMPDDMPFSLEDLDMEDDEPMQEDDSMKMAEGGYVMVEGKPMPIPMIGGQLPPITTKPMPETKNMAVGGMVNPSTYQVPTNIASQPSYFQNYAQSTAPFQPFNQQGQTTQTVAPPVIGPTQQQQTFPSFKSLMPQLTGKRETKEYRNDAGQKLFIPFINNEPIYPIPEGYTLYVAEEEATPETKPTVQSTSVRQDTGDGGDVGIETTRGMSIDKYGKGKTDSSQSVTDKTAAVMAGLQQNTAPSALSKGLQTFGKAAMGSVFGPLGGVLSGGKSYFSPDDTQNTYGLANALGSFDAAQGIGYDSKGNVSVSGPMASVMGINGALETLSQAAYGMSMSNKAKELGLSPQAFAQVAFTKGYKNGQVDPTTNNTYSHGQAGVAFGVPSYANAIEFGKAMTASVNTGFYGSLATAKSIATDPNKTDKQKAKAIAFGKAINPNFEMEIDDRSDAEVSQGLDDAQTSAVAAADEAVSQATSGQTTSSTGFTDMTAFGDDGPGDNSNSDDGSTDAVGGDGDEGESPDADDDPGFKQGGLAGKNKKKPKPKKMKRGGLASR